jgi:hypothetical protein
MSGRSDLAVSLVSIAIAALGGPLVVARTALAEVAKYAQTRYDEKEESRQIVRQVSSAVMAWARSEKLAGDDVDLGLELARDTVWSFGLSTDKLAELRFEATAAAEAVVAAAKAENPRWGTEDHYTVAVRAIEITYEALIAQLRAHEGTAVALFLTLRRSIENYATGTEDGLKAIAASSGDLSDALTSVGAAADVMSYLRKRIGDWDVSVWHHDWKASALERLLKVRETTGGSAGGRLLASWEALAGEQMLVVLGRPGAGKTWLARRYARQAAQAALSRLEDGAGMDEVELPLLTTWEQWAGTAGPPMRSLVASSFASGLGHGDAGGSDTTGRLERTFLGPEARVLLIVDSLDEASDLAAQGPRLRELHSLPARWRVVVTSRPAAWRAADRGGLGNRTPRVVELRDLSYPEEVETFVQDWFREAGNPVRGDELIREIRNRPEVARAAVVPLMLTFYCLIAEDPQGMSTPLPARRRELYRRLVRRLLRGTWTGNPAGPDAAPDGDYCEELLKSWAWAAVRGRTNAAGLGVWEDSFTQPTTVRQPERRAIDHIAPKTAEDDEGNITRRFVHRTFLEHFVAEHIATLDTITAADILLPHLWFDPDWYVAATAAIVAHNQQQKGALLQELLRRALQPAADPARQAARRELERLLLGLAEESEPDEWTQEHQDLFHRCRVDNAVSWPDLVARSAHWTYSNYNARAAMLKVLTADNEHRDFRRLAAGLLSLESTAGEREQARSAVLKALTASGNQFYGQGLTGLLPALAPTAGERAQARTNVLKALTAAEDEDPRLIGDLVGVLLSLEPTAGERAQARTTVLKALTAAEYPGYFSNLAEVMLSLEPTAGERAQARTTLLEALTTFEKRWDFMPSLAECLSALALTAVERAQARTIALKALTAAEHPGHITDLAEVLLSLEPTPAELSQARTAVVEAMTVTGTSSWHLRKLAECLPALAPNDSERAQARTAVLEAMTAAEDTWYFRKLAECLPALAPDGERAQARTAVMEAMTAAEDPQHIGALVGVLVSLEPTAGEWAQARTAVMEALTDAEDGWDLPDLVGVLLSLEPTVGERARARTTVLGALTAAEDPRHTDFLVRALLSLEPSAGERARARTTVLQALTAAENPGHIGDLGGVLLSLEPTPAARAQARTAVLEALITAEEWHYVPALARLMPALAPTAVERAQARTTALRALTAAENPVLIGDLAEVLLSMEPTPAERAQARTVVLEALTDIEDPRPVTDLAEVLLSLEPTAGERMQACDAMLKVFKADEWSLFDPTFTTVLLSLEPTAGERARARTAVLEGLTATDGLYRFQMLGDLLRALSLPEEWMAWLTSHN